MSSIMHLTLLLAFPLCDLRQVMTSLCLHFLFCKMVINNNGTTSWGCIEGLSGLRHINCFELWLGQSKCSNGAC